MIYFRVLWLNKFARWATLQAMFGIAMGWVGLISGFPLLPLFLFFVLIAGAVGVLYLAVPSTIVAYDRVYHSLNVRDGELDEDFVRKWSAFPYCDRLGFRLAVRDWKREYPVLSEVSIRRMSGAQLRAAVRERPVIRGRLAELRSMNELGLALFPASEESLIDWRTRGLMKKFSDGSITIRERHEYDELLALRAELMIPEYMRRHAVLRERAIRLRAA